VDDEIAAPVSGRRRRRHVALEACRAAIPIAERAETSGVEDHVIVAAGVGGIGDERHVVPETHRVAMRTRVELLGDRDVRLERQLLEAARRQIRNVGDARGHQREPLARHLIDPRRRRELLRAGELHHRRLRRLRRPGLRAAQGLGGATLH
jgi:hypothetical protein